MALTSGDASTDLLVTGPCEVKAGPYTFRNVNIYSGGSLNFDDEPSGIDFFAESILVENGGAFVAGSAAAPIGTTCSGGKCGTVTIHLWGAEIDAGITCKADEKNQCGVPDPIWTSNKPSMNPTDCTLSQSLVPPQNSAWWSERLLLPIRNARPIRQEEG
jgi:hypothetical protein